MIVAVQELENKLKVDRFDSVESKIDCLNELGWVINRENPKKTITLGQEALTLAKKNYYL